MELVEIAARRSSAWWLLSRLVMEQPQEPWLSELESMLAAVDINADTPLVIESRSLLEALRAARNQPDGLTTLAVDRVRLLAGVMQDAGVAAPFESAALGVPMNGDLASDVMACYADAGLEEFGHEYGPPDFLGTELRYMALLVHSEMQAYQAGAPGLASQWVSRERNFLDAHLLNWVPEHCRNMAAAATTPFYAALATLLGRACVLDDSDLVQVTAWLEQRLTIADIT